MDVALNTQYSTVSSMDASEIYWNNGNPADAIFQVGSGSTLYVDPYASTDFWSGDPIPSAPSPVHGSGAKIHEVASEISSSPDGPHIKALSPSQSGIGQTAYTDSLVAGLKLLGENRRKDAETFFTSYLDSHPDSHEAFVDLYSCSDSATLPDLLNYFRSTHPLGPGIRRWGRRDGIA